MILHLSWWIPSPFNQFTSFASFYLIDQFDLSFSQFVIYPLENTVIYDRLGLIGLCQNETRRLFSPDLVSIHNI